MKNFVVTASPFIKRQTNARNLEEQKALMLFTLICAGSFVYGAKSLLILAVSLASAFVFELLYNFICYDKFKVKNLSFIITALTYTAICEVNTPWYVPIIAMGFGVIVVKMMFGGVSNNICNIGGAGAIFTGIIFANVSNAWAATTGSSFSIKIFSKIASNSFFGFNFLDFVKGNISAPIGCVFFIGTLAAAIYLIIARVIDWKMPLVAIIVYLGMAFVLSGFNYYCIPVYLLAGNFLFVTFLMLTDYTTSPNTTLGQIFYALIFGLLAGAAVRFNLAGNLGIIASLLIANSFSPLLDRVIRPKYFGEGK